MQFAEKLKQGEMVLKENQTVILTSVGVVGTVATAYLSGKASIKATRLLEPDFLDKNNMVIRDDEVTARMKFERVWPLYLPTIGVGSLTILSIIMANRLSSKKAAALAAAYTISERAFSEYKEKVVEKIGANKAQAVRDEIAQDRINKNPPSAEIIVATGEVLCHDMLSGRYFKSTVEKIKQAQNKLNHEMINHSYVSLSAFYDEIDLEPNGMSEEIGWNMDSLIEVIFSTSMSPDQRPCIAIDFATMPTTGYNRLY